MVDGNRIKLLRKNNKITAKGLCEALGVTIGVIFSWQRNEYSPSSEALAGLAKALNTSQAYLLGETDDPSPPGSPPVTPATAAPAPTIATVLARLDAIESALASHDSTADARIKAALVQLAPEVIMSQLDELRREVISHEQSSTDRLLEAINAIVGSLFNMMNTAHDKERMGNVLKLFQETPPKVVDNVTKVAQEESKELRIIPTQPYIRTKRPVWRHDDSLTTHHAAGAGGISLQELERRFNEAMEGSGTILHRITAMVPERCPWAMEVVGHSMEPTIMHGTTIFYRRATWEEIVDNDIVLLYNHNEEVLKIRRAVCQSNHRCVLVADNPEYAESMPLSEDIEIVGVVLYASNGAEPERERERESGGTARRIDRRTSPVKSR
jgi:transcriptional regulator with XRE-family HTH domain